LCARQGRTGEDRGGGGNKKKRGEEEEGVGSVGRLEKGAGRAMAGQRETERDVMKNEAS
jgi:hypothetical protein